MVGAVPGAHKFRTTERVAFQQLYCQPHQWVAQRPPTTRIRGVPMGLGSVGTCCACPYCKCLLPWRCEDRREWTCTARPYGFVASTACPPRDPLLHCISTIISTNAGPLFIMVLLVRYYSGLYLLGELSCCIAFP